MFVVAEDVRVAVWSKLHEVATSRKKRGRLDAALRSQLTTELTPEIEKLAGVIERDLGHWLA